MISCNCPRCSEELRLATDEFPPETYAQCPWCRETFPAEELVNQLPPVAFLMDASGQPLHLETPAMQMVTDQGEVETENGDPENPFADAPAGLMSGVAAAGAGLVAAGAGAAGLMSGDGADEENATDNTVVSDTWQDHATVIDEPASDSGELENLEGPGGDIDLDGNESSEGDADYYEEVKFGDEPENATDADVGRVEMQPAQKVRTLPPGTKRKFVKKKSPIKTLAMFALGPVLAVPIAGGILYWLGNSYGIGPFANGKSESNRRAAPVSDLGSSDTPVKPPAQPEPDSRSLLDDDSAVAKAVKDIQETTQDSLVKSNKPPQITDLNSVPISLPKSSQDPFASPLTDSVSDAVTGRTVDAPVATAESLTTPEPDAVAQTLPSPETTTDPIAQITENVPDTNNQDLEANNQPNSIPGITLPELADIPDAAPVEPDAISANTVDSSTVPAESVGPAEMVAPTESVETVDPPSTLAPTTVPPVELPEMPAEIAKPTYSNELIAATNKGSDALNLLLQLRAQGKATNANLAETYRDIAAVGVIETAAGEPVQQLFSEIVASQAFEDFAKATPQWVKFGDRRPHEGILMIGTRKDARSVQLATGQSVFVRLPEGRELPAASRFIAIGKIHTKDGRSGVKISDFQRVVEN